MTWLLYQLYHLGPITWATDEPGSKMVSFEREGESGDGSSPNKQPYVAAYVHLVRRATAFRRTILGDRQSWIEAFFKSPTWLKIRSVVFVLRLPLVVWRTHIRMKQPANVLRRWLAWGPRMSSVPGERRLQNRVKQPHDMTASQRELFLAWRARRNHSWVEPIKGNKNIRQTIKAWAVLSSARPRQQSQKSFQHVWRSSWAVFSWLYQRRSLCLIPVGHCGQMFDPQRTKPADAGDSLTCFSCSHKLDWRESDSSYCVSPVILDSSARQRDRHLTERVFSQKSQHQGALGGHFSVDWTVWRGWKIRVSRWATDSTMSRLLWVLFKWIKKQMGAAMEIKNKRLISSIWLDVQQ